MGADGAFRTAVDAWYMPIPSTGRARMAAVQSFCSTLFDRFKAAQAAMPHATYSAILATTR
ncbi:hypothetical protein ADT25_04870 [Xanthomonas oryzae]|uniref:Uncharacterized protein n=1 Tax=Xanthomonas oryzae TaxID=347 RepID=A0AAP1EZM7_9XANT|nr:hypothetical protein ADT25_04870 [Xanthomonas oryzae]